MGKPSVMLFSGAIIASFIVSSQAVKLSDVLRRDKRCLSGCVFATGNAPFPMFGPSPIAPQRDFEPQLESRQYTGSSASGTSGSTGMTYGSTGMTSGSTGMTSGSTGTTYGSTGTSYGSTGMTSGSTGMTSGSTGMAFGSTSMNTVSSGTIPTWQLLSVPVVNGTSYVNPYPPSLPTDYYGGDMGGLVNSMQTLFAMTVGLTTVSQDVKTQLQNAIVLAIISPGCTVDVKAATSAATAAMSAVSAVLPAYAQTQITTVNTILAGLDCSSTAKPDVLFSYGIPTVPANYGR